MDNILLGEKVVFIRDHYVYSDGTQVAGRISYRGKMGRVVAVNPFRGEVMVVVCPDNLTVPMTTVDVSYLQLVKKGNINLVDMSDKSQKQASIMGQILEDMKPKLRETDELSDELKKLIDSNPISLSGGSHGEER